MPTRRDILAYAAAASAGALALYADEFIQGERGTATALDGKWFDRPSYLGFWTATPLGSVDADP